MKLRNKKTGEIVDIADLDFTSDNFAIWLYTTKYNSLAELNEEWEDYEEPKTAWYIDPQGDIQEWRNAECDDWSKEKAIGNYFDTQEEAEKAVEKLKAWKRLKDKGFRFDGYDEDFEGLWVIYPKDTEGTWCLAEDKPDLDLLFGGEE